MAWSHSRFAALVALLSANTPALAAPRPKLAVVDVIATGIDPKYASTFTEVTTAEVDALGRYEVIAGSDIKQTVGFNQERMVMGCDDDACIAEIGGALGVDRILVTQVTLLGGTYVLNIKLIDIKKVRTVARAYETVQGEMDALLATIRTSVRKLFSRDDLATTSTANAQPVARATESTDVVPATLSVSRQASGPRSVVVPAALAGTGVVAMAVGIFFGMRASSQAARATSADEPGSQLDIDRAHSSALMANIGYGVGVAGIASGALLWWMDRGPRGEELQVMVAPLVSTHLAGLGVGAHF
ncbi:MAG: hypothetical protein AAB426_02520 [Myxococcota bacterium]